jgi:hypothetical protein
MAPGFPSAPSLERAATGARSTVAAAPLDRLAVERLSSRR